MNNHDDIKQLISIDKDGQATPEEKNIIQEHIKECSSCAAYYHQLHNLSSLLKKWCDDDLSPDLEQKIQRGLKEAVSPMDKPNRNNLKVVASAATFVFLFALTFTFYQTYIKRGIQGRLKTTSDDIGSQFFVGNTNAVQIAKGPYGQSVDTFRSGVSKSVLSEGERGATQQYEPYYLQTQYGVVRDESLEQNQHYRELEKKSEINELASTRRYDSKDRDKTNLDFRAQNVPQEFSGKEIQKGVVGDKVEVDTSRTISNGGGGRFAKSKVDANYFRGGALEGKQLGSENNARVYAYSQSAPSMTPPPAGYYYNDQEEAYIYRQPAASSTETYNRIIENEFMDATQNPLSTLSIDVDTASYSNVRRFLNNNQFPPEDAVRIEELVNYFTYDYPDPSWNDRFSVTLKGAPCPWNPKHKLVQIGIQGKKMDSKHLPDSNLVFLIDVSGSMNSPDKLPLLKDGLRMMVNQLSDKERVAIVVYAGQAGLVLNSTPGSYKSAILGAIDSLQPGGSTAGAAGIQLAYEIAKQNFVRGGNNRVILATDGDFNVGISSDDELQRMIEQKRQEGIFLTVLGFGTGNLKDAKMETLADKGNGNYYYIDNQTEARKVLVHELGSTIFTIAKDVKIQVEFNPAQVKGYKLLGYENRLLAKEDFNDDTKDAGELGAGHTVTALYEIIPSRDYQERQDGVDPLIYQKHQVSFFGNNDLMTVKLRYKEPQGNTSRLIKKSIRVNDLRSQTDADFRFAAAVAEFGMILRNSPWKAYASYNHVLEAASQAQGNDQFGYRQEFIDLVRKAQNLDYRSPQPYPVEPLYDDPMIHSSPGESNIQFK